MSRPFSSYQRSAEWRWEREYEEICRLQDMEDLRSTDERQHEPQEPQQEEES